MLKPLPRDGFDQGRHTATAAPAPYRGKYRSRLRAPSPASVFSEARFGPGGQSPFPQRFAAALNRRLRPIGPLPREDFRQAIGVSMRQLESWLTGHVDPLGSGVDRAIRLFAGQPDGLAFLAEVYDMPPLVWLAAHRAALARVRAVLAEPIGAGADDPIEGDVALDAYAMRPGADSRRR